VGVHVRRRAGWLVPLIAVVCLVPSGSAGAYAKNAAEAIEGLNRQREASGIPAGITDRPEWNEACAAHLNWMALNLPASNSNPHDEIPGTPGYTEAGAWAGLNADLLGQLGLPSEGSGWYDGYEEAPYHLFPLLAPSLTEIGYVPNCVVVHGGTLRPEPATPQILTYPGNHTDFVLAWEKAEEWPDTPASRAGLPEGKITGPYILVYTWGAGLGQITSATLSGPDGPVEVRIVSEPGAGGFLIPPAPLTVGATYTTTVTYAPASLEAGGSGSPPITHEWSFTVAHPGRVVEGPIIGPPTSPIAKAETPTPPSTPTQLHPLLARIARVARNTKRGSAMITVLLPARGPGIARLWGSGVRTVREHFAAATAIKLSVTPTREMLKTLHRVGHTPVHLHVVLAQRGYASTTISRMVILILR